MKVLLDACVLYPTVMREVLLGVAKRGLYTPLWSARILEEWARAARKIGPTGEIQARAEVALVRAAFPQAEVKEHKGLEARLYLKDENDIHVLAAAIAGHAEAIVTMNAQDFPRNVLAEEGLERWDPDGFLWRLWSDHPQAVGEVIEEVRQEAERLSGEPWDVRRLLKKARLPRLGKALS
ncbi:RSP_2648 family PIN domain-containing protein [Celeribacter halophilus]|uniref:RSP_2648 family PIN domain-containing protein n=1 Tax=Celeribacter halophilus TaxID=576117 RepID=UPI001C087EA1|nr:PIN domain-containing protein [Celeribacter halophilus]MBU2890662.1 PIN domain-containing protein [Celeribacter halophilus]MDO6510173.1 PIN domain-containing protein [Celeribacter halophilus]